MKITKLILKGFKLIALTGYENIELTFTKKMQLVLGPNGVGKSSVINECSPLPVDKNHLNPNGYKEIHIEDKGNTYILRNNKQGKHEFIDCATGEELNPGHTQSVQKELIKHYFNYTEEIHRLIIGQETFTEMRPNRRKEWITKLSDVDYTYALKVFAQLKERLRDTQGAIKVTKKRLMDAVEQRVAPETLVVYRERISTLEKQLEALNGMRANTTTQPCSEEELQRYLDFLNTTSRQLIRGYAFHGKPQMDLHSNAISEGEGAISAIRNQISELTTSIGKKQDKLNEMKNIGATSVTDLRNRRSDLTERLQSRLDTLTVVRHHSHPDAALEAARGIADDIIQIFSKLPENPNDEYSHAKLQAAREAESKHLVNVRNLEKEADSKAIEIKHLKEHSNNEDIDCPKCNHRFNPSFDPLRLQGLERRQAEQVEQLNALHAKTADITHSLKVQEDYFEQYNAFVVLVKNTNALLGEFWKDLSATGYVKKYPSKVRTHFDRAIFDLETLVTCKQLQKEQAELDQLIARNEESDEKTLEQYVEIISQEESRLSKLISQMEREKLKVDKHKLALNNTANLLSYRNRIDKVSGLLKTKVDEKINHEFQEGLIQSIRIIQAELGDLVKTLNHADSTNAVIKSMDDTITMMSEQELALKALVTSLSPTDGLIAMGLTGFITHMTRQMNLLVNSIWSYSMNIIPPSVVEDDAQGLDYKFPFELPSYDRAVADVSLGSRGQREVIDLAFRMIACKYLHLDEIPVFADEFGTGFDQAHRAAAATAIKSILNESRYSQLFMISHYEDAYGSLVNAEVTVLSPNNISAPKEYNQHVSMT